MPAWVDGAESARTAPITGRGVQSQVNDCAKTALSHSSRALLKAQAELLLSNPKNLSPEVIQWAKRWSKT